MSTTPRLWKSQTQVNTTDAAFPGRGGTPYQYDGQIAALQDGGYVVVWYDDSRTHNPGGSAVLGQRYDAAGNRVGGEVKLSPYNAGDQFQPAVTLLPNGNIAVAFADLYLGDYDIRVRIFDPALNFVRQDDIDTGANLTYSPSLTAFADGSYAVSYGVGSGDDTDIAARVVSAAGVVGGQLDIHNEPDNSEGAQLATLSNGNFVAVYQDEVAGNATNTDILFKVFTPAGTPVAAAGGIVPGAGDSGRELRPDVAGLRDGGFVVVWTDGDGSLRDIRMSVLSNAGGTVASNILVNTTTTGQQDGSSVVALADGGFLVSWEDAANVVRAQRFDAAGGKIGSEFTVKNGVADGGLGTPEAAVLTDGRIALVVGDSPPDDIDVTTSIWTPNGRDAIGPINISAAGDFNSDGMRGYIWRDAGAAMAMTEYNATAQQVTHVELGTVGFSWNILAGDHFSNVTNTQMLAQNTADGTMSLWWVSNGQRVGVDIGKYWNGIDYLTNGEFTDASGAGIADFLVANAGDNHLYDWWIDANNKLQGIDLGAVWANKSLVGTGAFTPNGKTDFLVANAGDHHLYNWWIGPTSHMLQGYDLGAAWNNVGYIASGKFTASNGYDSFLVFNQSDHHLYNWWIDPTSHTLQGVDLGAAWSNVEFLAAGRFSNHTTGDQFLVRNTVDNHWYEWWIDPTSHTLQGIDLGARPGIELVEYTGYLNNNSNEFLVRNSADGDFYEWWISNNQLTGVDLII